MSGKATFRPRPASSTAGTDARDRAVQALLLMDGGMPVQIAVDIVLAASALAARDRRLVAELVYGCARERIRCDHILGRLLRKPGRLPRPMLHSLAIAVHSLLFQSRVPAHAAISECVAQVGRLYGVKLSRVANGVLRSLQRLGDAPWDMAWYEDARDAQAQRAWRAACRFWSLPADIADLWRRAWGGKAALALMRRSFQRPWTGVRINGQHPEARALREALEAAAPPGERASFGPWGRAFAPGALPEEALGQPLARLRELGRLDFQSAGSQAVLQELGLATWGEPVWDACAGIGGKSLALAEAGVPVRLCTDVSASRLSRLASALAGRGPTRASVAQADATQPPLRSWDGHILVDAPCSGLGVLARRPDIRFPGRRGKEAMRSYARTQGRILAALAARLLPARELAYLTCTLNPAENEAAVEGLLARDHGLELIRTWTTPPGHPWLEGMYGAVLRRR